MGGSAQPKFNKTDFRGLNVYFGAQTIVDDFEKICSTLRQKGELLHAENIQIVDLRDTLLPKLMSGELRVPETEKLLGEAV